MNAAATDTQVLAELRGITKRYGGIQALAGVDLDIRAGEIHAICGENGAGKSTLMKILAGVERADDGTLRLMGEAVTFESKIDANRAGIAIVFQELSLFPDLDVLANLFLLHEPLRNGLVDRRAMAKLAAPIFAELGLEVDSRGLVGRLSLAQQQLIEIARVLLAEARLLILDEPNSALNARETERLFAVVRGLSHRGVAVLFISHRLEEVFALSDRVTVLRNGAKVRESRISQTKIADVIADMLGPERAQVSHIRKAHRRGDTPITLTSVSVDYELYDVTFSAYPGEVVGLAGLEGAGVSTVFDLLFGSRRATSGAISLSGGAPAPSTPEQAVAQGIALVPADRRSEGLSLEQDISANIALVTAGTLGEFGRWLKQSLIDRRSEARADSLRITRSGLRQRAGNLSGGNQQKVVLAKWLEANPRVILLNDPTRGVDVGAKAEIYRIIEEQAEAGRIVLFHSTELLEFGRLCDRVLVFHRGKLSGELSTNDISEHTLLHSINFGISASIGDAPHHPAVGC
jgi:ABC-type sugar transport system ATPase subunit